MNWNPQGLLRPSRKTPLGEEAGESGLVFASGWVPGDDSTLPEAEPGVRRLPVLSVTSLGMLYAAPPPSLAAVAVVSHC